MASVQEAVRRLTVESTAKGVRETSEQLKQLGQAHAGVAVESQKTERATQSMERRLQSIQRQYDRNYRTQQQMARVERDLNAAQAQGLITAARKNELMALAAASHNANAVAAGRHSAALTALNTRMATTVAMAPRMIAGMLGVGGGVGGAMLGGAFLSNSVQQENAIAQLEATIRSTGGAAGLTSRELQAMADQIERVTKFSGDAAMSAQSVLLTYTQIGRETFPRAMQATIDMAQALGITLTQSAERVGRAIGYPSRATAALAQQGFVFTGQQLKMIKALEESGRMAEAQAIILGELEESYSGSARAARDTLGGALAGLRNVMDKLFEVETQNTVRFREEIERLTSFLSDPSTVSAFQGFGAGMLNGIATLVDDARNIFRSLSLLWSDISSGNFSELMRQGSPMNDARWNLRAGIGSGSSFREFSRLDRLIDPLPQGDGRPAGGGPSAETLRKQEREAEFLRRAQERRESSIRTLELERDAYFQTEEAAMRLRMQEEELAKLRERGIQATPELVAEIEAWAESYARITEENRRLGEVLDLYSDTFRGFVTDFTQGLRNGEDAWDSFAKAGLNALNRIADKLLDMALDQMIQSALGGIGGLFGVGPMSNLGGPTGSASLSAASNWLAATAHTGRGPGDPVRQFRNVHPAYFDDAPRFHSGKLPWGPGEMPAIIREDEGVFTPGQMRALGARASRGASESVVRIELADGLKAEILQQSGEQTVRIVQASNKARAKQYEAGGEGR